MHFIAFKEQMPNTANTVYTQMREKRVLLPRFLLIS